MLPSKVTFRVQGVRAQCVRAALRAGYWSVSSRDYYRTVSNTVGPGPPRHLRCPAPGGGPSPSVQGPTWPALTPPGLLRSSFDTVTAKTFMVWDENSRVTPHCFHCFPFFGVPVLGGRRLGWRSGRRNSRLCAVCSLGSAQSGQAAAHTLGLELGRQLVTFSVSEETAVHGGHCAP